MRTEYLTLLSLLGAAWVTFVPVATATKSLNETRDKVLVLGETYSFEHRELMLNNDWRPIFTGACVAQVVIAFLAFVFPWLLGHSIKDGWVFGVCLAYAAFVLSRLALFAGTHRKDYLFMCRHLEKLRGAASRAINGGLEAAAVESPMKAAPGLSPGSSSQVLVKEEVSQSPRDQQRDIEHHARES